MPAGSIKCPVCAICKATRTSSLGPSNRHSEKLSVVAVDLMGLFDPPTMSGGKYALTMRDTHTTYSEVKILKDKSEAAEVSHPLGNSNRQESQDLAL